MAIQVSDLTRLLGGSPEEILDRLLRRELLVEGIDSAAVLRTVAMAQEEAAREYESQCRERGRDPLEDTGPGFEHRSYVRRALERQGFLNDRAKELGSTIDGKLASGSFGPW